MKKGKGEMLSMLKSNKYKIIKVSWVKLVQ